MRITKETSYLKDTRIANASFLFDDSGCFIFIQGNITLSDRHSLKETLHELSVSLNILKDEQGSLDRRKDNCNIGL